MKAVNAPDPRLDTAFMDDAACRGKGDVFFPPLGGYSGAAAKAVCDACPVLRACDAYAAAAGVDGFWAGRWRRGAR